MSSLICFKSVNWGNCFLEKISCKAYNQCVNLKANQEAGYIWYLTSDLTAASCFRLMSNMQIQAPKSGTNN